MPSNAWRKRMNPDFAVVLDRKLPAQTFRDDVDGLDGSKFNVQSSRLGMRSLNVELLNLEPRQGGRSHS
jgi:hypothetical protein